MNLAIYPGTFDPATLGHLDIIERGSRMFKKLIVAVAHNDDKTPIFTVAERVAMLKELTRRFKNVAIDHFEGMSVDYVRKKKARIILRGIRTPTDFEYEFQMALTNRVFAPEIETLFIMSDSRYMFISSKLVKEAVKLKNDIDIASFAPPLVAKKLRQRIKAGDR